MNMHRQWTWTRYLVIWLQSIMWKYQINLKVLTKQDILLKEFSKYQFSRKYEHVSFALVTTAVINNILVIFYQQGQNSTKCLCEKICFIVHVVHQFSAKRNEISALNNFHNVSKERKLPKREKYWTLQIEFLLTLILGGKACRFI